MLDAQKTPQTELILGGQKSGKSRRAELIAKQWLQQSTKHQAVLIATAQPWDEEMRHRIARHQQDRALRAPGLVTVEEPIQLTQAIQRLSQSDTLIVVDCLTLWLTNLLMPMHEKPKQDGNTPVAGEYIDLLAAFLVAIKESKSSLVIVSNEIGLGVIPLGRETRAFVDALGRLNQDVAQACDRVTLMAAGLPLTLK